MDLRFLPLPSLVPCRTGFCAFQEPSCHYLLSVPALWTGHPYTTFAIRLGKTSLRSLPSTKTIPSKGSAAGSGLHQLELIIAMGKNVFSFLLALYIFFRTDPSGTRPVSKYFHNAINNLRANATMPTRRILLPPDPNRFIYH